MRRILVLTLLCGLVASTSTLAGSISGRITYDGKVPNLKPYDMSADPACAAKHPGGKARNQGLVLGDGNTLANIFVQVKNPPAGSYAAPGKPVVIDQNGCIYHPRVVGVMAGQPLQFKNSDGILHNVHGLPKQNREFNIGMPPTVKQETVKLNKPEPVFRVKCDVHPWQSAYVAVMTHPYFAVTGRDGTFKIDNVPDGTYEIEAWHEKLPAQRGSVTVAGGDASVDFTFK